MSNFDEVNKRRLQLIEKKYADGLSEQEHSELESLQEIAGQVRDALTPSFEDIQRTVLSRLQTRHSENR
jgi:hypothetical protein